MIKTLLCFIVPVLLLFGVVLARAQDGLIAEATVSATTPTAYDFAWHPDSDLLAVTGGASVTIYDANLEPVSEPLLPQGVNLAWSPDGDQLATVEGLRARRIRLWNWNDAPATVEESSPIPITDDQYAVTWSPDGGLLITLNDDRGERNDITLWDVATRSRVWKVALPYAPALRVLDWQGNMIRGAGVNENGAMMIYEIDPADGSAIDLQQVDGDVVIFAFSPDDSLLATVTLDGALAIFDAGSADVVFARTTVELPVNMEFSPDGQRLAVLGYERQMQIWDVSDLYS